MLKSVHLCFSIASAVFLTLAFCHAMLLMWQERRLRQHKPLPNYIKLPALRKQEPILFATITLSWVCLSVSLLSGAGFIQHWVAQHLAHKVVLSVLAWFVLGSLLLRHWRFGLRGRAAWRAFFIAYGLLCLAYWGTKWILAYFFDAQWMAG